LGFRHISGVLYTVILFQNSFQPIVLLHSMISYWRHHVVRPSVRLSVCLWRCAFWLSELVYRAKSCTGENLLTSYRLCLTWAMWAIYLISISRYLNIEHYRIPSPYAFGSAPTQQKSYSAAHGQ